MEGSAVHARIVRKRGLLRYTHRREKGGPAFVDDLANNHICCCCHVFSHHGVDSGVPKFGLGEQFLVD